MDSELNVLIVNPLLGTRGLMDLAGKLRAVVEVAEIGDVHGSMPCVLSAGVTARLQRDPRVWDWVISIRDGAGVAAQMVSRGQARFAVLMDPLVGLPELPGVLEALRADLHVPSKPTLEPLAEALALMTDTYMPDALFELMAEARSVTTRGRRAGKVYSPRRPGHDCRWTLSSSALRSGGRTNGWRHGGPTPML